MVAEPADLAVTTPEAETVATDVLLDDHLTALLVALEGLTVAVSVAVFPSVKLNDDWLRLTPVTEIVAAFTVTEHVAFFPPSAVVQVIVADPAAFAVTVPLEETVAIEVLLEDQDTLGLVALEGDIVAPSLYVSPAVNDNDVGATETPVTATDAVVTVTLQLAVFPPSEVFTVTVAVPVALAVTTPLDETVATDVLLEDQVTVLLVALEGLTVAFNVPVFPTRRLIEVLSRETPVTETFAAVTVTEQVAFLEPS